MIERDFNGLAAACGQVERLRHRSKANAAVQSNRCPSTLKYRIGSDELDVGVVCSKDFALPIRRALTTARPTASQPRTPLDAVPRWHRTTIVSSFLHSSAPVINSVRSTYSEKRIQAADHVTTEKA